MSQKALAINSGCKRRNSGFLHEFTKNRTLFFMTVPAVLFIVVFNYLPMFGVVIAFENFNVHKGFFGSEWVGFANFRFLFSTTDAYIITRNCVLYNMFFIIVGNIISLFVAITLNELHSSRLSKFYHSCMFLPYFLSWVVVSYIVFAFLSTNYGFVNTQILKYFGINAVSWYSEPKYWPFIIIFSYFWKNIGNNCVIYLAGLASIDTEYYEAATIDGATKWQQTMKITLPLMTQYMCILMLIGVGNIFRSDFGLFYQVPMNSGALFETTNVLDTYVYRSLMVSQDMGMSSAAGLYQSVVGFVLVIAANLAVKKVDSSRALF